MKGKTDLWWGPHTSNKKSTEGADNDDRWKKNCDGRHPRKWRKKGVGGAVVITKTGERGEKENSERTGLGRECTMGFISK